MDITELEQDRKIDPSQLDVEVTRQADTFFKWAEEYSRVKTEADRLEADLKSLEAKLQLECREHPDRFGLKNVTETAIKSAVLCSAKYEAAQDRYWKTRGRALTLEHAVKAMDQKKRMLELLVTLHGQQYFAGPSTPRDLVGAFGAYTRGEGGSVARQAATARKRVRKED